MYTYPWYHWITFFYLYCFFGWIFESAYVSLKKRTFINRGFLRLPMLPLYGTGAVMMLWVSLPVRDNPVLVYCFGVIAATLLEYLTGYVMERLFKIKYWDYSDHHFQLHGYICLSSSIAWGFLTIFMTEVIHKPVSEFVLPLSPAIEFSFLLIVSLLFIADTIQSTREALDLARALEAMTKMRAEMDELQLQLALLKTETSQRVSDTISRVSEWKEEAVSLAAETAQKAAETAQDIRLRTSRAVKAVDHQLREESLVSRIRVLAEKRQNLSRHMSFYRKSLLRGNPTASSSRFAEALKELRNQSR